MQTITEKRFQQICSGIKADREVIIKHNPIGTPEETLLWMLLGCLVSYLSLTDADTPCFNGMPNADTYRDAIQFVLRNRRLGEFDAGKYINEMLSE